MKKTHLFFATMIAAFSGFAVNLQTWRCLLEGQWQSDEQAENVVTYDPTYISITFGYGFDHFDMTAAPNAGYAVSDW